LGHPYNISTKDDSYRDYNGFHKVYSHVLPLSVRSAAAADFRGGRRSPGLGLVCTQIISNSGAISRSCYKNRRRRNLVLQQALQIGQRCKKIRHGAFCAILGCILWAPAAACSISSLTREEKHTPWEHHLGIHGLHGFFSISVNSWCR
jgi:hypothetical protein